MPDAVISLGPEHLPYILRDFRHIYCDACGIHPGEIVTYSNGQYGMRPWCAICAGNYNHAVRPS